MLPAPAPGRDRFSGTLGTVQPLLSARHHRSALVAALACWVLAVALAVRYAGGTTAGRLDTAVTGAIRAVTGPPGPVGDVLVFPTTPALVYAVLGVALVVELARREWWRAGFTVLTPVVAVVLTELVLKPLDGRTHHGYLSYPSGHTVSAVSAYLAVLLALTVGRPLTRRVGAAVLALVTVVLAVGLVAMDYHYPTDTVGGVCVAVGVVLPLAVAADRLTARRARPATAPPAGTPREDTSSGSRR